MTNLPKLAIPVVAVLLAATSRDAVADLPDTIAAAEASEPRALALGQDDETIVADDSGVSRLDAFGDRLARVVLDATVLDLAADPTTGRIAVLVDDAVVVLDPAFETLWQRPLRRSTHAGRVAIGERGTIAVVADGRVLVFDADGRPRFSATTDLEETAAIAVLDAAGLVVVGGTRRARACGRVVSDAALVAFDGSGTPQWDAWADAAAARSCSESPADSHVVDVRRGSDGALYVLADSEGSGGLFDVRTTEPTARIAYYARITPLGTIVRDGSFGFAEAFSTVRPDAIDADADGNVYVVGGASHELDGEGGDAIEAPGSAVGFYQMLAPDLTSRRVWRQFALDDLEGERVRLAVGLGRASAIIPATQDDDARIVALPTEPDQTKVERQPDRDDVGTFGYESGVSGADPTCYCDARRETPAAWWAGAIVVITLVRPRRRA